MSSIELIMTKNHELMKVNSQITNIMMSKGQAEYKKFVIEKNQRLYLTI